MNILFAFFRAVVALGVALVILLVLLLAAGCATDPQYAGPAPDYYCTAHRDDGRCVGWVIGTFKRR